MPSVEIRRTCNVCKDINAFFSGEISYKCFVLTFYLKFYLLLFSALEINPPVTESAIIMKILLVVLITRTPIIMLVIMIIIVII